MTDQRRRSDNQRLLIAMHIPILPLLTSFGIADAGLLQLYATHILHLEEDKIGMVIGLPALVIPLQLLGIYVVRRLGNKHTVMLGFSLLFCLLPLMLLIPGIYHQNASLGFALLCATVLSMHLAHNCTKGIALQPMIRESTLPIERGRFLGRMRLFVNGFNLLFFAALSVLFGARVDVGEYAWITFFLMGYCVFAIAVIHPFRSARADDDNHLPDLSRYNFLQDLRSALTCGRYRLILAITVLSFLSSLPLFVTYLSNGLQLGASRISQLIAVSTVGNMAGLFVWGRLIDRVGFLRVLSLTLSLSAIAGLLWLPARFAVPLQGIPLSLVVLALIAILTGFLQSGLKLALLVGVHNSVTKHQAIMALAIFNTGLMILGGLGAVGVGYYLDLTLAGWRFDLGPFPVDSYQILGLAGALLCAVAGYVARSARGRA
uniref:Major facilitator superfamily (MFS) profile domain-containing protein n=1 Tax=Candidatus Kentrum sp. FW TaxID=2126338 RepID=A0A450RYK1_9GAMM|nr:MAG: hypothetical protein BECKFW1821A_GA0114235_100644 [Candidatus Kentron sp. FW]